MASYDWIVSVTTQHGTFEYGIDKGRDGQFSVRYTKTNEFRGSRSSKDKAIELAKEQVKGTIYRVDVRS